MPVLVINAIRYWSEMSVKLAGIADLQMICQKPYQ